MGQIINLMGQKKPLAPMGREDPFLTFTALMQII